MRITSFGVNKNLIVKSGLDKIQSGDIFSIKIIENSNGRIKTSILGKIISVKSSTNLIAGQTVKVKAFWNGGTLVLNPVDPDNSVKTILSDLNMQQNPAVLKFFRSAVSSGLVLKDDIIKMIKRFLRNRRKLGSEEAAAAVELFKKGIFPENIINLICGGENMSPDEREDKKFLFNHLQDENDLWFIIPFRFKLDDNALSGSIRIKRHRANKKILKAVIAVNVEGNKLYFVIDRFDSELRKLYILSEGGLSRLAKSRIKNELHEILGNMSVEIDDNISENCFQDENFDGFSIGGDVSYGIEEIV